MWIDDLTNGWFSNISTSNSVQRLWYHYQRSFAQFVENSRLDSMDFMTSDDGASLDWLRWIDRPCCHLSKAYQKRPSRPFDKPKNQLIDGTTSMLKEPKSVSRQQTSECMVPRGAVIHSGPVQQDIASADCEHSKHCHQKMTLRMFRILQTDTCVYCD